MANANGALPLLASTPRSMATWQATACGLYWRRIDLDLNHDSYSAPTVLSGDEIERASRFVFARDRRRYIAGRTALRLALAEVLETPPERIGLCYGEHGKPRLTDDHGWHFNLSHSGHIGLIALGRNEHLGDVGIDVEELGPVSDWRLLADAHFSAEECHAMECSPGETQSRSFLACWTRKEACVKAIGAGLTLPTADFTVGLDGEFTVAIAYGGEAIHLSGSSVPVGDDCVAAIAWRDRTGQLCPVLEATVIPSANWNGTVANYRNSAVQPAPHLCFQERP